MNEKQSNWGARLSAWLRRSQPEHGAAADRLPGYNCGACGFDNCQQLEQACREGQACRDRCAVRRLRQ